MDKQDSKPSIQEKVQLLSEHHQAYFSAVATHLRGAADNTTRLTESRADKALQQVIIEMLRLQQKGRQAEEVFGNDPAQYAAQIADDILMRKPRTPREKLQYYTLIPWVALTWVFFIFMILGWFSKWFGEGSGDYEVSTATLVMIAGLSILLIELMTRFLGPGREDDKKEKAGAPSRSGINMKAFGLYIGSAVLLTVIGLTLGRLLPVFVISPWESLIAFAVGLAGQLLLSRRM